MKNKARFTTNILMILISLSVVGLTGFAVLEIPSNDGEERRIQLIVRADDMGITHATNQAVIESFRNGIVTAVEVIVPGPWFLDAVEMLREHPDLDVGVHLTLTSEWERLKWKPVTNCPSLVDSNGYFHPVIWQGRSFSEEQALEAQPWKVEEIEQELRGQIELARKHLPHISHVSGHMGFQSLAPVVDELLVKLAAEYGLIYKTKLKRLDFNKDHSADSYVPAFVEALKKAQPGTYLFVEHPAMNGPEMKSVYMEGYMDVATDRQKVTELFTDKWVQQVIDEKGITLISYKDLKNEDQ
ncbi:MAG: polysaccharide deacetylase family protein [Sphaerochaetaceae bacterium]